MPALLELRNFRVVRGITPVVRDLAMVIGAGEVLVLVGRNGAGKTSLLEGIAGLHKCGGALLASGRSMAGTSPRARLEAGIALCAEGRHLFPGMTVWDNLLLGGFVCPRAIALRRAEELAERFPLLAERRGQLVGTLSGGEQQLVALCRALMSEPRVLLLDEPTAGLAPAMRQQVAALIGEFVRDSHGCVVLVDDNLDFALGLADRVIAISGGEEAFRLGREERPTPTSILAGLLAAEQRPGLRQEGMDHV
jgi:branched-chain amino acid transport system ATP-binding protein